MESDEQPICTNCNEYKVDCECVYDQCKKCVFYSSGKCKNYEGKFFNMKVNPENGCWNFKGKYGAIT